MVRQAAIVVGVGCLAAMACTDLVTTAGGGGGAVLDTVATMITKVSGDTQTAAVGTVLPLPIMVQVQNTFNRPASGTTVCFFTLNGGSIVGQVEVNGGHSYCTLADQGGYASAQWQLGPSTGTYIAVATASGLTGVGFAATATQGVPKTLTPDSTHFSGSANAPLPDSLIVTVADTFGNAIANVSVSWAVTAGGGAISPAASLTDARGVAKALWTLGPPGADTATAAVGSLKATFVATSH